ncbi:hypothetical protein [Paenibacillus sacheonensis]|uniref:Uncharacterized protein n=1 Tax=Paenibacillus sacheonensis TaxID=742054 RepID=A0A7X4YKL9_9BACL|nr:hypothetical protein [Paenibacillus sacheonensis]MBM7563317.1 hypothetical protein [Paenibacillus sacheonensis]NBC68126.1 hypothetical protein [Paenibacillus sacheonensis]
MDWIQLGRPRLRVIHEEENHIHRPPFYCYYSPEHPNLIITSSSAQEAPPKLIIS